MRRRMPPAFMPTMPSSQPGITCPWPNVTWKGWLRSYELSNFLPLLASQPVYWTVTALLEVAGAPVPTLISMHCRPSELVAGVPVICGGLVGPTVGVVSYTDGTAEAVEQVGPTCADADAVVDAVVGVVAAWCAVEDGCGAAVIRSYCQIVTPITASTTTLTMTLNQMRWRFLRRSRRISQIGRA